MTDAKPAEAETIRVEREGAIAHVVLQETTMRPQFFRELGATFRTLARDTELRAVVLRSAVKCFSYGLDLPAAASEMGEAFAGGGALTRMKLLSLIEELQSEIDAVENCPVPTVVALHGWCIGGAYVIVQMCDLVVASETTIFKYPEAQLGFTGGLIASAVARIPHKIAMEFMLLGQDLDANRAAAVGMVNRVVPKGTELAAALEYAEILKNSAPLVVATLKEFSLHTMNQSPAEAAAIARDQLLGVRNSADGAEGRRAFAEKRTPRFQGR